MTLQYERSATGHSVSFWEKHVHIVTAPVSVGTLKDVAKRATVSRINYGRPSVMNTIMCMTQAQAQELLAWIEKNKAASLAKCTRKDVMVEIDDIKAYGVIVTYNTSSKKLTARRGGTLTLGFLKTTRSVTSVSHFSRHNWDGSHPVPDSFQIDPNAKTT